MSENYKDPYPIKNWPLLFFILSIIGCAYVLIFAYKETPQRAFRVTTHSMMPAIPAHALVWAAPYDEDEPIKRGDVIAYYTGLKPDTERVLVGRVVGLPGERLNVRDHRLEINGVGVRSEVVSQDIPCPKPECRCLHEQERLGEGVVDVLSHLAEQPSCASFPNWPSASDEVKAAPQSADPIPERSYWVMGDYRDQSEDSRHLGPVSKSRIVGKIVKIEPGKGR